MRCSVCGADNLDGSIYCEDCGARLPAVASAAPVTQETSGVVAAAPAPTPAPPVAPPPTPVAAPTPVETVPTPPVPTPAPAASAANQTCSACGAINPPGVAFCEDCGASLSETHAPIEPSGSQAPVSYDTPAAAPVAAPTPVTPPSVSSGGASRLVHTSGREFPLGKDLILMGRRSPVDGIYPEVDLTEVDVESYISRKHGRLTRQGDVYVYEDLGSSNGSFYNGTRLQPHVQTPLKEGDSIRLGKTELFLRG